MSPVPPGAGAVPPGAGPAGEDRWYGKAMVRVRDPEPVGPAWQDSHVLYNRALTPYTAHPLVAALGPRAALELGAGRLAEYLAKTEVVELEIVNRAVQRILELPGTPDEMRTDLLKVYTDEGYHVLMMEEFRTHIQQVTGLRLGRTPGREVGDIARLVAGLPRDKRPIAVICCAIVTETLITATLRQAGGDTVYPAVTRMLAEHATDEARHHAFFHRFADGWIPTVVQRDRALVESVLRQVLWYFLRPDFGRLHADLVARGLTPRQAATAIDESHDRAELRRQFLAASAACRKLIGDLGLEAGEQFADRLSVLDGASLVDLTTLEPHRS
ncbi:diiron oxygenase [Kitasatospora phosalacinea]|uniref:diiron oxygenase n=1 Tax=Kitasatospora phosalacinea TaxID=2065 RepID=UPI0035DF0E6B